MKQSRKPRQWDSCAPSVNQTHDQLVIGDTDIGGEGLDVRKNEATS